MHFEANESENVDFPPVEVANFVWWWFLAWKKFDEILFGVIEILCSDKNLNDVGNQFCFEIRNDLI